MNFSQWFSESREYTDADLRGKHFVPKELVNRLLDIEKSAYPIGMQTYEDNLDGADPSSIPTSAINDVFGCDGDLRFIVAEDWLILACEDGDEVEIQDFASKTKIASPNVMMKVLSFLRSFGKKKFTASARASTSYRLLKLMAKRGLLKFVNKPEREGWDWGNELMHDVEFVLT